jgi:hypothetical protein
MDKIRSEIIYIAKWYLSFVLKWILIGSSSIVATYNLVIKAPHIMSLFISYRNLNRRKVSVDRYFMKSERFRSNSRHRHSQFTSSDFFCINISGINKIDFDTCWNNSSKSEPQASVPHIHILLSYSPSEHSSIWDIKQYLLISIFLKII